MTHHKAWIVASWLVALCLFMPLAALLLQSLVTDTTTLLDHLWATVLGDYVITTIQLVFLVCLFAAIFALPSAWLIAMCEFKGRRYLQWLLMLPLAMPAYVVAYIYTDLFDFAGPVQRVIRSLFQADASVGEYWFFDIRNVYGAAIMLALVLYPYLYLIARTSLIEQGMHLWQTGRTLGASPWRSLRFIALPLCRPAIVAGLVLIGGEALGDFATVHYFAVNTLTTAVYDSWLGHGSLPAAAKLSMLMLLSVVGLLALERWQRGKQRFYGRHSSNSYRLKLSKWQTLLAITWSGLLLLAGFIVPVIILVGYAVSYFVISWQDKLWHILLQSVWLALVVAVITTTIAVLLVYTKRLSSDQSASLPLNLSIINYVMPSTVLAIGVLIAMTLSEVNFNNWLVAAGYSPPGLFLSGTVFALIFAFVVRFQAVANGTVVASFAHISPSLDMAAKTLGKSDIRTLFIVHMPLISTGLWSAILLVFIECMKELPAALLLRPFNFDTLATYVYQFVADEQLELAAVAAILIVLAGLVPVIYLTRTGRMNDE